MYVFHLFKFCILFNVIYLFSSFYFSSFISLFIFLFLFIFQHFYIYIFFFYLFLYIFPFFQVIYLFFIYSSLYFLSYLLTVLQIYSFLWHFYDSILLDCLNILKFVTSSNPTPHSPLLWVDLADFIHKGQTKGCLGGKRKITQSVVGEPPPIHPQKTLLCPSPTSC